MSSETQAITSNERSYFAIIPHLADDCLNVYEYRLYGHYRRVCGEKNNRCTETTVTTAKKLGISKSTVIETRQALADKGFITLTYAKLRNFIRVYVTLEDIWPQNMVRYAPDPLSTGRQENRYRSPGGPLPVARRTATGRHGDRHNKEELNKEELVKEELVPSFGRNEQTEEGAKELSFSGEEIERSFQILTDPAIRMSNKGAHAIATTYPFQDIRAFCSDFVAQGKEPGKEAGLIAHWLKARETVPPLIRGDLFSRHMTAEEKAQQAAAEAAAAAENMAWAARQAAAQIERLTAPAPESEPEPTVKSAEDIWASAKTELQAALPAATFAMWVNDTHAIHYNDGEFVIGVPHAQAREWLQNRLRLQIKRILGRLAGRAVDVTFQVRTHAQMEAPHENM